MEKAVSKRRDGADRGPDPADAKAAGTRGRAKAGPDFVTVAATIGVVTAGVALLEVALVPGLLIGGAAVLSPRYLPKYLPRCASGCGRYSKSAAARPDAAPPGQPGVKTSLAAAPARLGNQAGRGQDHHLSDHRHGPRLYLQLRGHRRGDDGGRPLDLRVFRWANLQLRPRNRLKLFFPSEAIEDGSCSGSVRTQKGWTISRALAKPITFRTIATVIDFTTLWVTWWATLPRRRSVGLRFRRRGRLCISVTEGLGIFQFVQKIEFTRSRLPRRRTCCPRRPDAAPRLNATFIDLLIAPINSRFARPAMICERLQEVYATNQ